MRIQKDIRGIRSQSRAQRAATYSFLFLFLANNLLFLVVAALELALGVFVFLYPDKIFKLQQRFYRQINWNISPISYEKEMRNTKMMGLSVILFVVLGSVFSCLFN